MRAIQLVEPRRFASIETAEPARPEPGQALVRTHRMGICGTDVSGYLGKMPFFRYPLIPGHELGVEVLAVGEGVNNVRAGDHCSVEPYMNCGKCCACRTNHSNCCETLSVIGVMEDGGLCERFLIRASKLHPSRKLSMDQLALVETLAIGCHATDRAAPSEGENVLIIGAGPIGLATLEFTRLAQPKITVMDMNADRLNFCRTTYDITNTIHFSGEESAREQVMEITGGDRCSIVIDATGSQHSMSAALQYVAHSGSLIYVGITTEEIHFPHPALHRPEMTIRSSRNALPADFKRIIGLIEDGTINTDPWITHRTSFDAVPDDFDRLTRPETGVIKAMIDVVS